MNPQRAVLILIACAGSWTSPARADGAFGRLEGDAAIQVDVGAGMDRADAAAVGMLTVRYLQTAGAYTTWLVHPGEHPRQPWTSSFGVELRPFFLPRFLKNMETGPAALDLMIDSVALRLGAVTASEGPFSHGPLGFEAGLGIGVPIGSKASGFWLGTSGALRWSHFEMGGSAPPSHRSLAWTVTLGWQSIFDSGLVDIGDARPR